MSRVPNRPTERGREMGKELARLADVAESELRKSFPAFKDRCLSCAFRGGTYPNGCEETVLDALKASLQIEPFMCHMSLDANGNPAEVCAGWLMVVSSPKAERVDAPWEYSHRVELGEKQ